MRHVFRATKIGWDKEQEGIWFDSAYFQRRKPRRNSNRIRELQGTVTPIRDMSMISAY